jgi:glycosidase
MSIAFPIVPWGNGTNIYEVNVRQYTPEGTLKAFMQHLPRLCKMGVEILWFMPLTPISVEKRQGTYGSYYAASSYTDIDKAYGTGDDFKEMIKAAHECGMKVIIDWVANHTGYDHVWTDSNPDFYRKDDEGNFTELYGWVDVIDLNYENPALRAEMIRSMKHWIKEYDIDGFRCDMARTVPIDFWLEARSECDAVKPLFWLAECEILEYHEVFDLTYGWEVMRAFDKYFKDEIKLSEIIPLLHNYSRYPAGSKKLLFTSNHDENTDHGTEYEKYGVCAQAMAVFSCTWPGIPLLYSGQEKPNKRRLPFFEKDNIDWSGEISLAAFYEKMYQLRKTNLALEENASVLLINTSHNDVLVYLCRRQNHKVLVILNLGFETAAVAFDHPAAGGDYTELFTGEKVSLQRKQQYQLQPGEYKVWCITHTN